MGGNLCHLHPTTIAALASVIRPRTTRFAPDHRKPTMRGARQEFPTPRNCSDRAK